MPCKTDTAHAQDRPAWQAAELAAAMGITVDGLRRRMLFWISHGVLQEIRTPAGLVRCSTVPKEFPAVVWSCPKCEINYHSSLEASLTLSLVGMALAVRASKSFSAQSSVALECCHQYCALLNDMSRLSMMHEVTT